MLIFLLRHIKQTPKQKTEKRQKRSSQSTKAFGTSSFRKEADSTEKKIVEGKNYKHNERKKKYLCRKEIFKD